MIHAATIFMFLATLPAARSAAPISGLALGVPLNAPEGETAEEPPPAPSIPFRAELDAALLSPAAPAERHIESWPEARRIMRERSTDLRIAEAEVQRAEGMWRQALATLLPNGNASVSAAINALAPDRPAFGGAMGLGGLGAAPSTPGQPSPTVPLGTATVTITQSLINVGAWKLLEGAGAGERSAAASFLDLQRRLTLSLAQGLIAVVAAERVAEINRSNLRQALERNAMTQRTFELGAATQLDVVRVRQDVAVARAALLAGDEELRRTREALGLILGIPEQVGVAPTFALDGLLAETQSQCRALATDETRSDIIAAQERAAAAQAVQKGTWAGYLPTLGITSTLFGYTSDPGVAQFPMWNIAAVISLPLWEGGLREGLVAQRTAEASQATEVAEATRRSTTVEIARARRGEAVARDLMQQAEQARDLAAETDALTRRSFEMGRATSLELVQSAATLRQAELNLALRQFQWVRAQLDAFLTEAQCGA